MEHEIPIDPWRFAFVLIRAYLMWAALIGHAVLIASHTTGIGWKTWIDAPYGGVVVIAIFLLSGFAGCFGEWLWRMRE